MFPGLESLSDPRVFEWDEANSEKNWERHQVRRSECEEVFAGRPLLLSDDLVHSSRESRFLALGRTLAGRGLLVAFTVRGACVRVVSARDMSRKERRIYDVARNEEAAREDPRVS